MKRAQSKKNNDTYVIRLTLEEIGLMMDGVRQLSQTNKTIELLNKLICKIQELTKGV